ncbi:MAG TPA: DegT/DnrJ/EryC1/StrS family aminotransferase [Elainellaceae cyanobacterium]
MNPIPLLDLKGQYQSIEPELSAAAREVLASGQYIKGPHVQAFEQNFARYIGTQHCIACNSGTDALYLALRALNVGSGDEIITTPFTFIATAEVISAVGATPVFIDINPQTFNLDLAQIESAITSKTRAIMPVHLFGQPVDMTQLMAIAQAHQLWVIEDCAQAAGADWVGERVGSIGHIGCFSFYPTKNLGACGDGGAITTDDETIAAKIRMLADHGRKETYYHEAIGVNSRLDALQAAILDVKLRYLDAWNIQRQAVADRYSQLLDPLPHVIHPHPLEGGHHVWHQYTIRIPTLPEAINVRNWRDRTRQHLQHDNISSTVYYPLPIHLQPVYEYLGYQSGQFPAAEQISRDVLSLPMYPDLSSEQQEKIVYSLKDALTSLSI